MFAVGLSILLIATIMGTTIIYKKKTFKYYIIINK